MSAPRSFRFGHQVRPADPAACVAEAQRAQQAGFDIVTIPDHVGVDMQAPMILATAIAQATDAIRVGTFVLNNEMRNPVQLAWQASAVDQVSDGRFELGLGAGHTPHEFAATGIAERTAAERKERLVEAFGIVRQLLDGASVTSTGGHYGVVEAAITPARQTHLPIMLAGNGDRLLRFAGQHADIVGLNGLGRRLADGHRHAVKFGDKWLAQQIATVHEGAVRRDDDRPPPELNALVQRVIVTNDRQAAAEELANDVEDLTSEQALTTPYVAIGSHEEIAEHFATMRDRYGISYFVTRSIEEMAPVIEMLRGR